MDTPSGWFSIRQVAERVGVTTQVVRKWEQRYQLLQPRRLPNGYRVYSEHHIEQLLAVKVLMEQGYSVQNAMIAVSLQHTAQPTAHSVQAADLAMNVDHATTLSEHFVTELLRAGEQGNIDRIGILLQRSYHTLGLPEFSSRVLQPVLEAVGVKWSRKLWSEYQEHLMSNAILNFLQRLRGSLTEDPFGKTVLCSTVPYERHDLTLQVLMLHAVLLGWRVSYLGVSPAPGALADAVDQLRPAMVIVSITTSIPLQEDPNLIRTLSDIANAYPGTPFWLGRPFTLSHSQLDACPQILQTGRIEDILTALTQNSLYQERLNDVTHS